MILFASWRPSLVICMTLLVAAPTGKSWPMAQDVFVYRERTGDQQQIEYRWSLEQRNELFIISSIQPEKQFQTVCTADGATLSWSLQKSNGESMTAHREGNTMHLFGKMDGKTTDKDITIDDRPWFQPLSFSLRSMVTGTKTEQDFWIVRPDNFSLVVLKAEKNECRTAEINNKEEDICEVEIKKKGWLASFWHASYWFRKSDGLFVEYRSVHGLPGTSETVIQLIQDSKKK